MLSSIGCPKRAAGIEHDFTIRFARSRMAGNNVENVGTAKNRQTRSRAKGPTSVQRRDKLTQRQT